MTFPYVHFTTTTEIAFLIYIFFYEQWIYMKLEKRGGLFYIYIYTYKMLKISIKYFFQNKNVKFSKNI